MTFKIEDIVQVSAPHQDTVRYDIYTKILSEYIFDTPNEIYFRVTNCVGFLINYLEQKINCSFEVTSSQKDYKKQVDLIATEITDLEKGSQFFFTILKKLIDDTDFLDVWDSMNTTRYSQEFSRKIFDSVWLELNLEEDLKEKKSLSMKTKI